MRNIFLLLMASTLAVCAGGAARQADEADIREAVFRCPFTNDSSGIALKGKIKWKVIKSKLEWIS